MTLKRSLKVIQTGTIRKLGYGFLSVRHSTLLHKVSSLPLPDEIYNWIKDFFEHRSHCTRLCEEYSEIIDILASVIQGSALGPATFVINGGDLHVSRR